MGRNYDREGNILIEAIAAMATKALEVGKEVVAESKELPNFAKDMKPLEVKSFSVADQPLQGTEGKDIIGQKEPLDNGTNEAEVDEAKLPIQNKIDGLKREADVLNELQGQYPEGEGYKVESEVYLRDADGKIVKDPVTGEARRIDFVVTQDGSAVDSIEVTSQTADKVEQSAKEDRIRENGGNYIKNSDGEIVRIPDDVKTRIERRD